MFFKDYKNKDILYISDKNYKKILPMIFDILSIDFAGLIILLFLLKDNFFDYIFIYISAIFFVLFFVLLIELLFSNKKIAVTKNDIFVFNFWGKKIKQISLKKKLFICYNNYCFFIQDENKNTLKICHERNNKLLYNILIKNNNTFFVSDKEHYDFSTTEKVNKIIEKIIICICIVLNLFLLNFSIHNRNEIISYYYVYKGKNYLKIEAKTNNSGFIEINTKNTKNDNMAKAYNYYKNACYIYPNQKKSIYNFILIYAKTHNFENDYNNFYKFSKQLFP